MSNEMALIRVQTNELALAERKIDGQIARAKKGRRIAKKVWLGGTSVMSVSLLVGAIVVAPHIVLAGYAVGVMGMVGGMLKDMTDSDRVSKEKRHREELGFQRLIIERDRLFRLKDAATAALWERGLDALASGQEIRLDFEGEAPKILRIDDMDNIYCECAYERQRHLRIAASFFESEAGPDGTLRRAGTAFSAMERQFGPLEEVSPAPSQPEKKLPPCGLVLGGTALSTMARHFEPAAEVSLMPPQPAWPEKKLPPCVLVVGG